jgi:hypothetical protein
MTIVSDVAADRFFQGEDKILRISVYEVDGVTPKDVTGKTLSYVLQKTAKSSTPLPGFPKTTADDVSITGVFNVNPSTNTQKVEVEFFDEDTDELNAKEYYHELKDMTDGAEIVLMKGTFTLTQSAPVHRGL